ncbi:MAG: 4-hydroxy-tetrahydrodipicolinate reductase [Turicibacter sp.]|nr:4-hydroxy-tetrahydrodipicolinate reductase [Turicibacter sp.]
MNVLLIGTGAMGKIVQEKLKPDHDVRPISNFSEPVAGNFDLIIDFSHPSNLASLEKYVKAHPTPLVIATTGYDEKQIAQIEALGKLMPVLFSANFSMGVILMNRLIKEMARVLSDSFDIEVIEKHHHLKVDAPSGTAKMLVDSLNDGLGYEVVHGREGMAKRTKQEIGVHTIRGGSIVGEHEVLFAGADEIISIKHEALSKSIFATGAIRGGLWLTQQGIGLYNMEDVLFKTGAPIPSTEKFDLDGIVSKGRKKEA